MRPGRPAPTAGLREVDPVDSGLLIRVWLYAVKHHPHFQIVAAVFEAMLDAAADKHQISGLECVGLTVMDQNAPAADDNVDFVLLVRTHWRRRDSRCHREPHVERASAKDARRVPAAGTWKGRSRVGEPDESAMRRRVHTSNE